MGKKPNKAARVSSGLKHSKSKAIDIKNDPDAACPLTPQQIQAAHVLAMMGYTKHAKTRNGAVNLAAREAGVNQKTIHEWLARPEFTEHVETEKAITIVELLRALRRNALERGDTTAAIYRLKVIDAEMFDDKIKHLRTKHEMDKELLALKKDQVEAALAALPALVFRESADKQ